ncbi:amidase signature enzyme [Tothia fuscella]|uniref:Amidase signature enzyme n=1 Tax=Tothia fuscella TaxID=1048955 RepID=A0A9P4NQF0_9PEZI|nr:amidase signature enzyme [Tothia fuscella]
MSVVFLSLGEPTVTANDLKEIAAQHNVVLPSDSEADYLYLLNSLDATAKQIADLPEYLDPRLKPDEVTLPRKWSKPQNNPLNAWSHLASFTHPSPKDQRLSGRTIAFKDNISVAGIPLTAGTFPELFHGKPDLFIPTIDAIVVKRVLQSGVTVLGSATCEHFSMTPLSFTSATGPVQNPWLKGWTTGGSSSGPAALVAVKQVRAWRERHELPPIDEELGEGVDMAIGGDQGGSIRVPAAYCGIYGLKPTHGLVPYTGILGLVPMVDHTGPLAASLEDTATLLSVLAGYDGIDPRMTPESPLRANVKDYKELLQSWIKSKQEKNEWTATAAARSLRIGLITESLNIIGQSDEIKSSVLAAVQRYRDLGATVEEVSIPIHLLGPSIWTIATRAGLSRYGFQNIPPPLLSYPLPDIHPPPFDQKAFDILTKYNPAVVNVVLGGTFMNEHQPKVTSKAIMHVHELRIAYDAALEKYDVLIMPCNPRVGSKHPTYDMSVAEKMAPSIGGTLNTCGFNISGHPALSMPIGFTDVHDGSGKLPVAMQIVGRRFDEETIFKAAAAWEVVGLGLDQWDGR